MAGDMTLAGDLAIHTKPGELYELLEGNRIRCLACGHRCPIPAGFTGVCKVRFNREGSLRVPYGYVNSLQCDPIEKKPFFHALPGTDALSFGMLGCCLHCGYCQNWVVSQALRDIRSSLDFHEVTPRQIVSAALASGASSVISTYNEPLITSEWAAAIFRAARAAGLVTGYVTNGNATPEVLEYLRPWLDLVRVDLKTMDDGQYHKLGGRLKPVLDSIRAMHAAGFWLEVVTLIVPGFNDSARELEAIARYLVGVSPDIPWHVTAFHKNYRMTGPEHTTRETLRWAAALARDAGLRYVYAGNLPGQVGDLENTRCPTCGALLIERCGFRVRQNGITRVGGCPECRTQIPGFWRAGTARRKGNEHLIDNRCG